MEQSRIIIAIVLSLIVLFAWDFWVNQQPRQTQAPVNTVATTDQQPAVAPAAPVAPAMPGPAPAPMPPAPTAQARLVTIDTPLYRAQIDEHRGSLVSFVLKNYRQRVEPDAPLLDIVDDRTKGLVLALSAEWLPGLANAVFTADTRADTVRLDTARDLTFSWQSPDGIAIEKRFTFHPQAYVIDLVVSVHNGSGQPLGPSMAMGLAKVFPDGASAVGFEGASALLNDSLEQIEPKKIADKPLLTGNIGWITLSDRYFISALLPAVITDAQVRLTNQEHLVQSAYVFNLNALAPGGRSSTAFKVYAGPKSMKDIAVAGQGLDRVIDYGWFDIIAKPCVHLMNFIYAYVPNYGVVIIILTILLRILMWPLGNKSYKSMAEMKRIQPLMAEIRERHKDNKQKQNEEIMALYRTYKVNPVGGCLPMILQLPIFIALYRMLYEAIELRHAPFIWWMNDLSAPDRLFRFPFAIPFMEPPHGVPVLTLIMGATMVIQQKMSPPAGDPTQAKMMMLMPVVFTFIFINFSSGLVLYWLISNVISIGQQYYVTKKHA